MSSVTRCNKKVEKRCDVKKMMLAARGLCPLDRPTLLRSALVMGSLIGTALASWHGIHVPDGNHWL